MTEISANLRGKKSAESNCHRQLFLSIGEGEERAVGKDEHFRTLCRYLKQLVFSKVSFFIRNDIVCSLEAYCIYEYI
jgi:hypothetical protein